MINAEKYKDEIIAIVNDSDYFAIDIDNPSVVRHCGGLECKNCVFNNNDYNDCNFLRMNWLLSEYKEPIKVSRLEYEILKFAINKNFEYIARDYDGQLYAFMEKPYKGDSFWKTDGYYYMLEMFSVLFQFVKWEDEEPKSIKKLLNNCEVVDDE